MNANVCAFDQFILSMLNPRGTDSGREREKRRIASGAPEGPTTLLPQDRLMAFGS